MKVRGQIPDIPKPGVQVRITSPYITKGKVGDIEYFDNTSKKWKIRFDNEWIGWYKRFEFQIIEE